MSKLGWEDAQVRGMGGYVTGTSSLVIEIAGYVRGWVGYVKGKGIGGYDIGMGG